MSKLRGKYQKIFDKGLGDMPAVEKKIFLEKLRRYLKTMGAEEVLFEEYKESCRSNMGGTKK